MSTPSRFGLDRRDRDLYRQDVPTVNPSADELTFTDATIEDEAESKQTQVTNAFLKALRVTPQRGSRVIKIAYTSENPRKSAKIANTLAEFYIVAQLEVKFAATQMASKWLSERLEGPRSLSRDYP